MQQTAICVSGIGKQYRIGRRERYRTLRDTLAELGRHPFRRLRAGDKSAGESDRIWALRDVSFEVEPGEVVGIIGRNGAGKSTLLKILSRITEPTTGEAELHGRVGSLLEVGTGFNPELTGRENVYLNGAILGMRRAEIARKFDEIVAFAAVETFLDTPVKHYSSGMYMRLAFAVAAHLDPEILVIDEVLAVGDATFQRRCLERMAQIAASGTTVLLVSHNMQIIPRLCTRALLLQSGRVERDGDAAMVTQHYLNSQIEERGESLSQKRRTGDGRARFRRIVVLDPLGQPTLQHTCGTDLHVRLDIEAFETLENVAVAIVIQTLYGTRLITSWTKETGLDLTLKPGWQVLGCRFENVWLRPGHTVQIGLWMASVNVIDHIEEAEFLEIIPSEYTLRYSTNTDQGVMLCPNRWELKPSDGPSTAAASELPFTMSPVT